MPAAAISETPAAPSEKSYLPRYTYNDDRPWERGLTCLRLVQSLLIVTGDAHREVGISPELFDEIAFGLQLVLDDAQRDLAAAQRGRA
ncbi:hypothetical protein D9T17_00980 [Lysobacter enzymogenes]|uniref:Uncharacterized protein n=2 Tax=Lysobacter enzymogenes TaxID=69 RepID=A0A3N2RQ10_LYSEN|nr:hypothetical protein D9T17_00980 [Lysobacter enzymogenes]